jgi:hypothetical protein
MLKGPKMRVEKESHELHFQEDGNQNFFPNPSNSSLKTRGRVCGSQIFTYTHGLDLGLTSELVDALREVVKEPARDHKRAQSCT